MEPGAVYCPACGSSTGSAPPYENQNRRVINSQAKEKIRLAGVLLFLGAIVSFILGAYYVLAPESLTNTMVDMLESMGYDFRDFTGMTPAEYKDSLIMTGYAFLLCGVMCLIPAILCFLGKFWALTLVLSIVATALGFYTTLFGGIIGIIVIWFVYKYKAAFELPA